MLFNWFEQKGRLRYKPAEDGNGCVFFSKTLLKDMKDAGWFDLDDKSVKKELTKVESFKKGTTIGKDYFIEYGVGSFY